MRTGKWDKAHCRCNNQEVTSHWDEKHVLTFRFQSRILSPSSRRSLLSSTSSPQSLARLRARLCKPLHTLLFPPCCLKILERERGISSSQHRIEKDYIFRPKILKKKEPTCGETVGGGGDFAVGVAFPRGFLETLRRLHGGGGGPFLVGGKVGVFGQFLVESVALEGEEPLQASCPNVPHVFR